MGVDKYGNIVFLLFAFLISNFTFCLAGTYSGGDGSASDPFRIATPNDLNEINNNQEDWDDHFVLTNDINMAAYTYNMAVIAPDVDPGRAFDGVFDGNDFSIDNLTIDTEDANNDGLGLFGLTNNAEINDLNLNNTNVTGGNDSRFAGLLLGSSINSSAINCHANGNINSCKSYIGLLTGLCSGLQIQDCSVEGTITSPESSWYVGGLAGACQSNSVIQNSQSNVSIFADNAGPVGGLIGYTQDCNIIDCNVTGIVDGNQTVGGLIGGSWMSSITNCNTDWTVSGPDPLASFGGLIGMSWESNINECTSQGSVSAHHFIGGLIGEMSSGQVTNSSSSADVSAAGSESYLGYIGGLVGRTVYANNDSNKPPLISDCFATGNITGGSEAGGLVGESYSIIENCYAMGDVSGESYAAGLVGLNAEGSITDCYALGDVEVGTHSGGGLVGDNRAAISRCFAAGQVIGSGADIVGGLVGINHHAGQISDCYATGYVKGVSIVGGLVGESWKTITNCYSTGSMSYIDTGGGLLGLLEAGSVTGCFWDTETSGQTTSAAGTGKTTDEMQTRATFTDAGWDVDTPVWDICLVPIEYPRLSWQMLDCARYSGGIGSIDDPFLIATPNDLNELGLNPGHWDTHFLVVSDISLSDHPDINTIGYYNSGIDNVPFSGTFDGNGHTISQLIYDDPLNAYVGLFGYIAGPNALVKDIHMTDAALIAYGAVGALVGRLEQGSAYNCTVENSYVYGKVYTGGLIGHLLDSQINNCYFQGAVIGYEEFPERIGGLVGYSQLGSINNCYAIAELVPDVNADSIGGLIGRSGGTAVVNCFAESQVTPGTGFVNLGGLIGTNYGSLANSYSKGSLSGDENIGGIAGFNSTARSGSSPGS
ncbi:MAG: GLUG motif-containing protein, partial [Planctomycetota bacterium]